MVPFESSCSVCVFFDGKFLSTFVCLGRFLKNSFGSQMLEPF